MSRYFHRVLTVVLAMTLLFTAIPFQAAAEPPPPPETGYVMDMEKGLCLEMMDLDFTLALNDLNGFTDDRYNIDLDRLPENLTPAKTLSKEKRTGSRFLYNISYWSYTKNKLIETQYTYEIRPNELRINGKAYKITQKQYESLKKAAASTEKNSRDTKFTTYYPIWTTWTLQSDVVKLEFRDKDKLYSEKTVDKYKESSRLLSAYLYNIWVSPETKVYKTGSKIGKYPDALEAVMTLKSGRKLSVIINGETLYVEMSDRDYGYEYKFSGALGVNSEYTRKTVRELLKKQ